MKHKLVKQSSFFKVKDGTVEKLGKQCDRCGEGIRMAEHGDRWYCGQCKMTIWKKVATNS